MQSWKIPHLPQHVRSCHKISRAVKEKGWVETRP